MASPSDLAASLHIPVSQLTPAGLLEHEWPGITRCVPDGPAKTALLRMGQQLLDSGLQETDGAGSPSYANYRRMIQSIVDQPEVQDYLRHCQGGAGESAGTTSSAPPDGSPAPSGLGMGWVIAGGLVAAGALWAAWWVTHRPGSEAGLFPERHNPGGGTRAPHRSERPDAPGSASGSLRHDLDAMARDLRSQIRTIARA